MNALTEILSHPFVHKLGWTLLHLLWQGAVVALLLAIVLRFLRKSSANLRYVVACSALAVVVILPVVTIRLVPAPPSYALLEAESASLLPPMAEAMKIVPVNLEAVEPFPAIGLKQRVVNLLEPTLPYIVAGWVLGVFTLSLWHLGGWTHVRRIRRRLTKQADETLLLTLRNLAGRLRIARAVQLFESALVQIPTVVGWMRPVILLPACALTGLTTDQLEALLAHELAHVRRCDYLVNILQTVVEILAFYHPAVWWISNKIRLERENCCDDIAVAICGDKMHYATALAEMERIRSTHGELALAANGGNLLVRIRRLIGGSPAPKQRFNWAAAMIIAMVIAALAIPTTLALSRSRTPDTVEKPVAERTIANDNILSPASTPVAGETDDKAQILFELKIFQLPADSKLVKDAGKDGTFVRTDKIFVARLLELSKESKDAKVLSAPRVTVLEGEEAMCAVGSDIQYTSGYTEQPGEEPRPITKTVHQGLDAKMKGDLAGENAIRVCLIFTQTEPALTTHKVAKGREIQIPVIQMTECSTIVTIGDGGTVVIGGLQSPEKSNQTLLVQMTARIAREGRAGPTAEAPPNEGSAKEAIFAVAPQVVTSVRVDTQEAPVFPGSGSKPAKAVEELIAMLKGQAPPTFDLFELQTAVADQLDDLRKLVAQQSVEIDSVLADDKQALIATKSLKDDRGREGRLVFHLARKDGKWIIDDIDFEDPQGLEDEIKHFNEQMRRPGTPVAAGPDAPPAAGTIEAAADSANIPDGIVGSAFNLQAIGQPLRGPDTPQSDQIITIFKLQYANCELLADTLMNLLEPDEKGPVVKIVPDESSNSLIIQANSAERDKIEDLIAHLDRAERSPAGDNKAEDSEEFRSLQSQRKQIADKAKDLRRKILQLQQDIGAADLKARYDVGLQRVVALMSELGTLESGRISLEARVNSLENAGEDTMDPTETFRMRHDYVNNDATVKALADKLAQVEMELILARQNNSEDSPEVKKQVGLIEALRKRLDEAKDELGKRFDELIAAQAAETHKQQLGAALAELDRVRSQEDRLRKELAEQDARVVQFGQKQLEIQIIQNEIDEMQQEIDEIDRRTKELKMQQTPPAATLFEISESATEQPIRSAEGRAL